MYNLCGNDQGTTALWKWYFQTPEKRVNDHSAPPKEGEKMGSKFFSQFFWEVGIGGEHPKVDLAFISDRILSIDFSK